MDGLTGRTFGPYKVLEKSGEGGMGLVYKGFQESLNRYVAIKVLRGELARDQQFIARFRPEALAVAKLSHPNILHIFDTGAAHGTYYIVMDYVDGGSLSDLIARGPLDAETAVSIAAQVADALDYAHSQSLIHRDVKPANVLLTGEGRPLLTDFGIARALDASTRLTRTGTQIGTPEYMAPEQAQGEQVDGRTDIYALGIVLYEMLTGWAPFSASTPMATLYKQVNAPLPPLRQTKAEVPTWLESVVKKSLAKRPQDRFQRASEFAAALRRRPAASKAQPLPVPPVGLQPPPRRTTPAPSERQRKRNPVPLLLGAIGILLLVLAASGAYLALSGASEKQKVADLPIVVTHVVTPEQVVTVVITSVPGETPSPPPAGPETVTPPPAPTTAAAATSTRSPIPPTATTAAAATTAPTVTTAPTATTAPTKAATPTKAPTRKPTATAKPQTKCPAWYSKPQPGMGILVVENHIGEDLLLEQTEGGSGQWNVDAKQGDVPGRLLLQLSPGDHFFKWNSFRYYGTIRLHMEEGQQFVSPLWLNWRSEDYVYPLEIPPGCS